MLQVGLLSGFLSLAGCIDDEPPALENEEEIITDIKLTFTPTEGGSSIEALAQDPDGEGPESIKIVEDIVLEANKAYDLSIDLENSVAGESITEEVEAESDEHLFLFEWTDGLFSAPTGDGNYDNRADPVTYNDQDVNQLPVGLSTHWITGAMGSGTFHVVLKHQPDTKSATSDAQVGESDVDLTWGITIE